MNILRSRWPKGMAYLFRGALQQGSSCCPQTPSGVNTQLLRHLHKQSNRGECLQHTSARKSLFPLGFSNVNGLGRVRLAAEYPALGARLVSTDPNSSGHEGSSLGTTSLKVAALATGIPAIAFGFADNFIMVIAGEQIDEFLGVLIGMSTLAAAGLGNLVSDCVGVVLEGYIERHRSIARLSKQSSTLPSTKKVKYAQNFGKLIGMSIGCLLGMIPLLIYLPDPIHQKLNSIKRSIGIKPIEDLCREKAVRLLGELSINIQDLHERTKCGAVGIVVVDSDGTFFLKQKHKRYRLTPSLVEQLHLGRSKNFSSITPTTMTNDMDPLISSESELVDILPYAIEGCSLSFRNILDGEGTHVGILCVLNDFDESPHPEQKRKDLVLCLASHCGRILHNLRKLQEARSKGDADIMSAKADIKGTFSLLHYFGH